MKKLMKFSLQTDFKYDAPSVQPPVFLVQGHVLMDDLFQEMEGRARQGAIEHVTFESVGMTAEDIKAI